MITGSDVPFEGYNFIDNPVESLVSLAVIGFVIYVIWLWGARERHYIRLLKKRRERRFAP